MRTPHPEDGFSEAGQLLCFPLRAWLNSMYFEIAIPSTRDHLAGL